MNLAQIINSLEQQQDQKQLKCLRTLIKCLDKLQQQLHTHTHVNTRRNADELYAAAEMRGGTAATGRATVNQSSQLCLATLRDGGNGSNNIAGKATLFTNGNKESIFRQQCQANLLLSSCCQQNKAAKACC